MQSQDSLANPDRMELDSVQISEVTDSKKSPKNVQDRPYMFLIGKLIQITVQDVKTQLTLNAGYTKKTTDPQTSSKKQKKKGQF